MAGRLVLVLVVAVLAVVPAWLPKYALEVLISVLFFGYLGSCWNILGGYGGQFSFGHAAFFGLGAYTSTLLLLRLGLTPWLGMLAGGALAAAFGLFEGYLSFRYGLEISPVLRATLGWGAIVPLGLAGFVLVADRWRRHHCAAVVPHPVLPAQHAAGRRHHQGDRQAVVLELQLSGQQVRVRLDHAQGQ